VLSLSKQGCDFINPTTVFRICVILTGKVGRDLIADFCVTTDAVVEHFNKVKEVRVLRR
jgi:hypothetical protein